MRISSLLLFVCLVLTACAHSTPEIAPGESIPKKSMTEDYTGSPEKIALLRERAEEFYAAFVKGDYEKVYSLYDPFFRARYNKYQYIATLGKIKYHSFEIKEVTLEGNIGTVKVNIVYSMPPMKFKEQTFSKAETPAEFEAKWLYIYDNWYKEYYSSMVEAAIAEY